MATRGRSMMYCRWLAVAAHVLYRLEGEVPFHECPNDILRSWSMVMPAFVSSGKVTIPERYLLIGSFTLSMNPFSIASPTRTPVKVLVTDKIFLSCRRHNFYSLYILLPRLFRLAYNESEGTFYSFKLIGLVSCSPSILYCSARGKRLFSSFCSLTEQLSGLI